MFGVGIYEVGILFLIVIIFIVLPILFFTQKTQIKTWLMRKSEERYFRTDKNKKNSD